MSVDHPKYATIQDLKLHSVVYLFQKYTIGLEVEEYEAWKAKVKKEYEKRYIGFNLMLWNESVSRFAPEVAAMKNKQ